MRPIKRFLSSFQKNRSAKVLVDRKTGQKYVVGSGITIGISRDGVVSAKSSELINSPAGARQLQALKKLELCS